MPETNKNTAAETLNDKQLAILAELNRRYDAGEKLTDRQTKILAELNRRVAQAMPQPTLGEALKTRLSKDVGKPTLFGLPIGGTSKGVVDAIRVGLNVLGLGSDLVGALAPDRPGHPESVASALARGRKFSETLEPSTREAIGQGLAFAGGSIKPLAPEIARTSGGISADFLADPLLVGPGIIKGLRNVGKLEEVLNLLRKGERTTAAEIIKALPSPRIPAEGVPVSRIKAAGELPPAARFKAGPAGTTKNLPGESAIERLARLEEDVAKAGASRQILEVQPPALPPGRTAAQFEVLPGGPALTPEQSAIANLGGRGTRLRALPAGEDKNIIIGPGFRAPAGKETVSFRGFQKVPRSDDAMILVDLPNGSTVGFDETIHHLPKSEIAKIRQAANETDFQNIFSKQALLERYGQPPGQPTIRAAEKIGGDVLTPRQVRAAKRRLQGLRDSETGVLKGKPLPAESAPATPLESLSKKAETSPITPETPVPNTPAPETASPLETLAEKSRTVKPKGLAEASTTTAPKQTFREFVESKGIEWSRVSGKNRDPKLHEKLFDEYTKAAPPTTQTLSGKEFTKGLFQAAKKDISGEGLGVIADPYRHTRDFLSKNSVNLTDEEIEGLTNFTRKITRAEGVSADDQVRLINDYIKKNIKSPIEQPGISQTAATPGSEGFPIPPRESFGESRFKEYTDAARQVLRDQAIGNEAGIKAARRGVITNEQLIGMANKKIRDVEQKLFKGDFKPYASEEENLAARMLLADELKSFLDGVISDIDPKKVEAVFGGKAFAGRLLQSQKIPLFNVKHIEKIRQKLQDLPEGPVRDGFAKAVKAIGLGKGEINPSALDKFVEWATMIKLTGISTQVRNLTGNTAMLAFRPVEKAFAGPIDAIRAAISGTNRTVFAKESLAEFVGMGKSFKNAVHRAITVLHDPTAYFDEITKAGEVMIRAGAIGQGGKVGKALDALIRPASRKFIAALPENISGKVFPKGEFGFNLGENVRAVGRLLSATDVFFKEINSGAEIYALATRKALQEGLKDRQLFERIAHYIQNPTDDMLKLASESAKERTFQEELTGIVKTIDKVRSKHPTVRLFVPFFRTPVNILKQSLQRTPMTLTLPSTWKVLLGDNPAAKVELVSRALSGSAVLSALGIYALEGKISGRGTNSKARRNMMRLSGWQPYSIKIGDQWVSYSGFEPLSSWLRTVADIAEGSKSDADIESIAATTTTSYIKQFAENPFLVGMKDIVNAFDTPENRLPKMLAGLVTGSTIPVILQQWGTRVYDPVIRQPRNFWQQIQARLPFGPSKEVPPLRNVFGDEVVRENPVLQSLGLTVTYEKSSKMGRELARLSQLEPGLVIGKPSRIVNGTELTDDEYDRFLILKGAMFKKQLSSIMSYEGYDQLTDDMKVKIIKRLSSQVNNFTRSPAFTKYYTNRNIQ